MKILLEKTDGEGSEAISYVDKVKSTVETQWREIATKYKSGRSAISFMEPAFDMNFKK